MKLSHQDSIKALEQARLREKDAVELYQKCLDDMVNEAPKVILKTLVGEEQKHYDIVTSLLNDADASVPTITATSPAKEVLDAAFGHASMQDFSADLASLDTLLEQALKNEKESFNVYSSFAESSDNSETKAVYQYLANEENKHYIMVSNLLSYLGDPGRWLYEEENLIFRRG